MVGGKPKLKYRGAEVVAAGGAGGARTTTPGSTADALVVQGRRIETARTPGHSAGTRALASVRNHPIDKLTPT